MSTPEYRLSTHEIRQLEKYARQSVGTCSRVRCVALAMIASGVCIEVVSSITRKNKYTIKNWFMQYMAEGVDSLGLR